MTMGPGYIRGDAHITGFSVATDDKAWYFPLCHPEDNYHNPEQAVRWFKGLMANKNVDKIFHNAMYDLESLDHAGMPVDGTLRCTMTTEALIDENQRSYSLDNVAARYGITGKDETLLVETAAAMRLNPKSEMWKMPARFVGEYAEQDALILPKLLRAQEDHINADNLAKVYDLESRLIPVLYAMRKQGVRVNEELAVQYGHEWKDKRDRILKVIAHDCGFNVDIWSDKHLVRIYQKFNINVPLTPKGNPSFEGGAMMLTNHPTLVAIAEARKVDKMRRDFIDGYILKYAVRGRLHPQYHSTRKDDKGTRSGRLSSSNPNAQQVPARDPVYGPALRKLFLPDHGARWGKFDYSSQEPRLTLHFAELLGTTGAKRLADEYRRNPKTDFHSRASELADIPRRDAKAIGLGLTYGMGKDKTARELGRTREEADPFFEAYNNAFPFLQETAKAATKLAAKRGYIRTILGRRSRFPDSDFTYKALNRAVQGSGADFMKSALVNIYEKHSVAPLLTVHDEGDYNIHDEDFAWEICHEMSTAIPCNIPMVVDPEVGPNWGSLTDLEPITGDQDYGFDY
jgi:Mesyanzhinovviridae DNA polymerase